MKYIILILLLCPLASNGQTNCESLSAIKSFHGLFFGEVIPDSVIEQAELSHDKKSIIFRTRTIKKNGKDHLLKYLYFDGPPDLFSWVSLSSTQDNKLYRIFMSKPLDETDSLFLTNGKMPMFFTDLYNKVSEMFGAYSDKKIDTSGAYMLGFTHTYIWDCGNMELKISLWYGGLAGLNTISLEMVDFNTKRKGMVKGLQN